MRFRFDRDARRRWKDLGMGVAAFACVVIALIPLGSILVEATVQGAAALGPNLLLFDSVNGGIVNAIQGTLILIALSSGLALPLGILAGIYIAEYRNRRPARAIRFFTDVMTQIPSIVMGVFAYSVLFELALAGIVSPRLVFSTITGTLALSIIMIPFVTRTTDEALRLVPTSTREAALALGIPRYRVTLRIVLASASSGLVTGALLAVARAAGETAPLLMTAYGNSGGFAGLDQPIESMTHTIYVFALDPSPALHRAAWAASLILTALMLATSIASRALFRRRFAARGGGA